MEELKLLKDNDVYRRFGQFEITNKWFNNLKSTTGLLDDSVINSYFFMIENQIARNKVMSSSLYTRI